MRELMASQFTSVLLDAGELASERANRIILSFDDGYRNAFELAGPVLAEHGFKAIQYIVSGRIGGTNDWDAAKGIAPEPLMDETEIREWLAAGHQIGAHTVTHASLTSVPISAAREEITASKKALEDRFGIPIHHFCYPYGNLKPAIVAIVEEAGFQTACSTRFGVNAPKTPPLEMRRIIARYRTRSVRSVLRWLFS